MAPLNCGDETARGGFFKAPQLRNIALTAPYFHNGSQLTLEQVVEFYDRGGDFNTFGEEHQYMDSDVDLLGLTLQDKTDLVDFLRNGLTDPRTVNQAAPFDHPQLLTPNGHPHSANGYPVAPDPETSGAGHDAVNGNSSRRKKWRQTTADVPGKPTGGDKWLAINFRNTAVQQELDSFPPISKAEHGNEIEGRRRKELQNDGFRANKKYSEGSGCSAVADDGTGRKHVSPEPESGSLAYAGGGTSASDPRAGLSDRPAGILFAGQIQYASLDATPGLCNKDDNTAPTPDNPPLPNDCKSTGGWIQANNELIRIPAGTIVVMPNTFLTWEELFEFNPNTHQTDPVFQTGLAMADTVRFPGTYQATIDYNIINGQSIAGIVRIAQDGAAAMEGFIESIDYARGELIVNGQRIQINDPKLTINIPNPDGSPTGVIITKGRYTAGQSADPRMTVDQGNTTVRTATGFNMCIPVVPPGTYNNELGIPGVADPYVLVAPAGFTYTGMDDPQCPEINRKRDIQGLGTLAVFTMNAPGDAPTPDNPFPQDPYAEMPFEVGDFVDIIPTQEMDDRGPFLSATEVVGNIGVSTAPGVDPAYVVVEVTLMGTAATPDPAFPQEAGVRTRVEGFTTDPTRTVDVSAIDYDCNGNVTFREPSWVANFPVEPGPPGIGKRGRWRMRFPQGGQFMPPTQNIGARVSGAVLGKNKSGSDSGEYQLPTGEFIYPELLVPGNPPVPFNFIDFVYLTNGSGPLPLLGSVFDSTQIQLGWRLRLFIPTRTRRSSTRSRMTWCRH